MATVSETKTSSTAKGPNNTQPTPQTSKPTDPSTSESDPTANFDGDIDVTNDLPTKKDLSKAADLPILAADGTSHAFKTLYTSPDGRPKRALIIFVRHFFCGNCQEYLRTLCASIPPSSLTSLSAPTTVSIIGCGTPSLIEMYATSTSCTFPIYADPTYALYRTLGMARTLSLGPKKPDYLQTSQIYNALKSIVQSLSAGTGAMKGGDYKQVGGEFLMEEGKVVWCHRMRNTRDHAEIPVLRERLGLDGPGGVRRRKSVAPGELLRRTSRSWSRRRSVIMGEGAGEKRNGSTAARERRGIREEEGRVEDEDKGQGGKAVSGVGEKEGNGHAVKAA